MMEEFKMGIFTGIEILFFWLGAISALMIMGLVYLRKTYILKWHSMSLSILGIILTVFTIAWSVSSILEGEPQAANMGMLFFGLPVLIIFGITRRLVIKDTKQSIKES